MPEYVIKKLRETHMGKIPWNKGKKCPTMGHVITTEERKKISLKNSGCGNGRAILKESDVLLIKKLYNERKSNKEIATITNIKYRVIYCITSNRTYKNI
jgi:hypothetical protein